MFVRIDLSPGTILSVITLKLEEQVLLSAQHFLPGEELPYFIPISPGYVTQGVMGAGASVSETIRTQ